MHDCGKKKVDQKVHGEIVEQKVHYDWIPPFCHKCQTAGHDCGKKKVGLGSKPEAPKQQWIPKVTKVVTEHLVDQDQAKPGECEKQVTEGENAERVEILPKDIDKGKAITKPNGEVALQTKVSDTDWSTIPSSDSKKRINFEGGSGAVVHTVDEGGSSSYQLHPA